jgi:hypothetical protein
VTTTRQCQSVSAFFARCSNSKSTLFMVMGFCLQLLQSSSLLCPLGVWTLGWKLHQKIRLNKGESSSGLDPQARIVFWSSQGLYNTTIPVGLSPLCTVLEFECYPLLGQGFLFTVTLVFLFALSTGSLDTWLEASSQN